MKTYRNSKPFVLLEEKAVLSFNEASRLIIRAEKPARVYMSDDQEFETEVLAGYGIGEFEVEINFGCIRVASDGRVWVGGHCADQHMERMSDETFVSLERPPALSPEMLAIQRMVKRNEIAREREWANIERMQNDLRDQLHSSRTHPAAPAPSATPAADDLGGKPSPEPQRSDEQKGLRADQGAGDAPALPDKKGKA